MYLCTFFEAFFLDVLTEQVEERVLSRGRHLMMKTTVMKEMRKITLSTNVMDWLPYVFDKVLLCKNVYTCQMFRDFPDCLNSISSSNWVISINFVLVKNWTWVVPIIFAMILQNVIICFMFCCFYMCIQNPG